MTEPVLLEDLSEGVLRLTLNEVSSNILFRPTRLP